MSENIKNTAITAAGYIYQNRQGLKILCDWLDAPARYSRVKFECDDENEAPIRETDEETEAPDEFEEDDEDDLGHPEDDDADDDFDDDDEDEEEDDE